MTSRFDILLPRIAVRAPHAAEAAAPGDRRRAGRDERHAKPAGGAKPLARKERHEHRDQHDA